MEHHIPLNPEMIQQKTDKAVEALISQREVELECRLIPQLRYELAIQEAQQLELARIESEIAVTNLASELVLRIKGGEYEKAYACFALNTPGVSAEISGLGVYEGAEALKSYFVDYLSALSGGEGCFKMDHLTTPVLEVAADNNSARGMWHSVGMEAYSRPDLNDGNPEPISIWAFDTWCMEFVKDEGAWKIWKLYVLENIATTYEQSWSEILSDPIPADPAAPKATRPSQRHDPFTAERGPRLMAEPPVPYAARHDGMSF